MSRGCRFGSQNPRTGRLTSTRRTQEVSARTSRSSADIITLAACLFRCFQEAKRTLVHSAASATMGSERSLAADCMNGRCGPVRARSARYRLDRFCPVKHQITSKLTVRHSDCIFSHPFGRQYKTSSNLTRPRARPKHIAGVSLLSSVSI